MDVFRIHSQSGRAQSNGTRRSGKILYSVRLVSIPGTFESFLESTVLPDSNMYLAQHDLLKQMPDLRDDIIPPDYLFSDPPAPPFAPQYRSPETEDGYIINAWLGPCGTTSPAHTDPYYNCYAQVVGRKWVWLAPPSSSDGMYAFQSENSEDDSTASTYMTNTSKLDPNKEPIEAEFPLFHKFVKNKALQAILEPGDLMILPPGWWHAVISLEFSFSVSMW